MLRWFDGDHPGPDTFTDWARFGRDLAGVVAALHRIGLAGAQPTGSLHWYRGERLSTMADEGRAALAEVRQLGQRVDMGAVAELWE